MDELTLIRALYGKLPKCKCGAVATTTAYFSIRNGGGTAAHCDAHPFSYAGTTRPLPYADEVRAILALQG